MKAGRKIFSKFGILAVLAAALFLLIVALPSANAKDAGTD